MSESFSFDNLIAGSQKKIVQRLGTIREGDVVTRGELLGRLKSTGEWTTCMARTSEPTSSKKRICSDTS